MSQSLAKQLHRLDELGVVGTITGELDRNRTLVSVSLGRSTMAEIPQFAESGNPDVVPELKSHAEQHIATMRDMIASGQLGDFGFVRAHAAVRAVQRFPLEASLHAYRLGHRVIARWIREAATTTFKGADNLAEIVEAIADFAIEYTDTVSNILAAEYVANARAIAEADVDRDTELLDILLQGYDESDGRVAGVLRRAGYLEQRRAYVVVTARSVDAAEMENPARARRMAESLVDATRALGLHALTGVRDNLAVAVFSGTRRQSGWTRAAAKLAERLNERLLRIGPAALIGMSADAPSTALVPRALGEARTAVEFATVERRVVAYSDLALRDLLIASASESLDRVLPGWGDALDKANRKSRGRLVETLKAYADASMNALDAARRLDVHPNTVYQRLKKIEDTTGLDPLEYHSLGELLLAADLRETS
ncbi:MAG: helix-turn-helix domain-containing protein [Pseudomonadota bacterium]